MAAICIRDSRGSKPPTSRNTIVAHKSEQPYFTTKPGRPSGKPYQRRHSPQAITASASPKRGSDRFRGAMMLAGCARCIA